MVDDENNELRARVGELTGDLTVLSQEYRRVLGEQQGNVAAALSPPAPAPAAASPPASKPAAAGSGSGGKKGKGKKRG